MAVPTTPAERALLPDALRGIAIGGILLVNAQFFAGYAPWLQTGADRIMQVLLEVLINGKFVSLFALLFGSGVAIGVTRGGLGVQLRRLFALLLLGLAHGVFVWAGDILATYALVGFALALVLRAPGLVLAALATAGMLLTAVFTAGLATVPPDGTVGPESAGVNLTYRLSDYWTVLPARVSDYSDVLASGVLLFGPWLLGLFLTGVLIARTGVLRDPRAHRRALLNTLLAALAVGVPLNLLLPAFTLSDQYSTQTWGVLLRLAGGLAFALAYGATLGLLAASRHARLLRPLAAAGRLSLTNYLTQSVVFTLLFNGYGLGLYGTIGAQAAVLLSLALYALQIAFSTWYLHRYRTGPAEWLLRLAAYGNVIR